MLQNTFLETILISSLAKVFADEELKALKWNKGSMLSNEVYSFQIAYRNTGVSRQVAKNVTVKVFSELSPWITIRKVDLIPSEMPNYADHDDNILRKAPGLYPDLLQPMDQYGITLLPDQWRTLWISVDLKTEVRAGSYPIEIAFVNQQGEELGKEVFQLEVLGSRLPKQTLIHTEWFHTDCIATWYGVDVFSDEYWKLIDKYIITAVKHGINMILTPLFTPPLDTQVGEERPTVQLVDVEKTGGTYKFGFKKLERWVEMCLSNGVEYFEFSHLFTQWGAKHAPKIIATENGEIKKIFGWETDAAGDEYKGFLDQFLPALVGFIKDEHLEKRSFFHVSDEPNLEHLESYGSASNIIKKHLGDFLVIDALSAYEFYENGMVTRPIPATNHLEAFLEHNVPDLWTYYCCGQYRRVANRFFSMPSARNRILGMQLYKFKIVGFLQWGYNFWYSQFSLFPVDPFRVTDAAHAFPSGDAFMVYPGKEGPLESLRLEVFYEALQDLRSLKLLEDKIGRDTVINLLERDLDKPITFNEYPTDESWLLNKREEINRMICENEKARNGII